MGDLFTLSVCSEVFCMNVATPLAPQIQQPHRSLPCRADMSPWLIIIDDVQFPCYEGTCLNMHLQCTHH